MHPDGVGEHHETGIGFSRQGDSEKQKVNKNNSSNNVAERKQKTNSAKVKATGIPFLLHDNNKPKCCDASAASWRAPRFHRRRLMCA